VARLTDPILRSWLAARAPIAGVSDGGGLTFTLSPAGTASWVLRYRLDGRQRELTLGNYPDVGLADARRRARAARAEIDAGRDVAHEKRKARSERVRAGTFAELAADYRLRGAARLGERSRLEAKRYLDKDILPRLGRLPAREVSPEDVIDTVEAIARRSDAVARNVFVMLNVIFAHGMAKRIVLANPCAGLRITAILGERAAKRPRLKLSLDELRQVFAALPALGRPNELTVKILLATCVRRGELVRARWEHVDLERATWSIPDEHSKSGHGFVVPLAPLVARWFRELQAMAGASAFVLPARTRIGRMEDRHINERTLNAALANFRCGARAFSPHDLRSTARSHLAELGVELVVAERCLNHSLGGLVAVYDKHDYMTERRAALERWAQRLGELEPRTAAVIPMRAAGQSVPAVPGILARR